MFKKLISIRTAALLLSLAIIGGANYPAYAQKHGKGNGKSHGDGGDKNKGEKHGDDDDDRGKRRGNEDRSERPRYERQQMPQAVYDDQQQSRGERGNKHGNGKWKQKRGDDRPPFQVYQPQIIYDGGWVPPGQIRSRQVHERNDARKAWKDQEKAYKRWSKNEDRREQRQNRSAVPQWWDQIRRVYPNLDRDARTYIPVDPNSGYSRGSAYNVPYSRVFTPNVNRRSVANYSGYEPYGYEDGYDGGYDNGGSSWKSTLLRMLISSVLSGFGRGDDGNSSPSFYQPYYSGIPVNYNQAPSFGNHSPQYTASPDYGQDDGYGEGPNYGSLLGALPIAQLFGGGNDIGGLMSGGLSQVLAQGYLQGMTAGESARDDRYGNRGYNDPYVTNSGIYDQGSSTIAENRRLLSEGYALGYQDAMNGREQPDTRSGGGLDLVNVLLSNVFNLG